MALTWTRRFVLPCLALMALGACSETKEKHCLGTEACLGEWKVFEQDLAGGAPCTTPVGDLHVRYEKESSDEIMAHWAKVIPAKMGLSLRDEWRANQAFRQAWYRSQDGKRLLNVGIVQSGSTRVRTLRLSWEQLQPKER